MGKNLIGNAGNHILFLNEGGDTGQSGSHKDRAAYVSTGSDNHIGMEMLQNGPCFEKASCRLHENGQIFGRKGPFQPIGRNGCKLEAFLRNDSRFHAVRSAYEKKFHIIQF